MTKDNILLVGRDWESVRGYDLIVREDLNKDYQTAYNFLTAVDAIHSGEVSGVTLNGLTFDSGERPINISDDWQAEWENKGVGEYGTGLEILYQALYKKKISTLVHRTNEPAKVIGRAGSLGSKIMRPDTDIEQMISKFQIAFGVAK